MRVSWLINFFFLATVAFADAQHPAKVPRIGILSGASSSDPRLEAFRQGLRELGYVEGRSIVIEYRFTEGKEEPYPELASELVRMNVDLIVAATTAATRAAKKATSMIPIVMLNASDPVAAGLIASLAKPAGNVTGMAQMGPELMGKRLEVLQEGVRSSRVVFLVSKTTPLREPTVKELEVTAKSLGVQLQVLEMRPDDFESAFKIAAKNRAALILPPDQFFVADRKRVIDLTVKHRLPAMYPATEWANAGGLMVYGHNVNHLYHRAPPTRIRF